MKKRSLGLIFLVISFSQAACVISHDADKMKQNANQALNVPNNQINQNLTNPGVPPSPTLASADATVPTTPLMGGVQIGSMDENDKAKLSHALDNGTGKSTHWTNSLTGVSYTVTPTRKVVVQNNPYCREYMVTSTKGEATQQRNGVACVTKEGAWQSM